MGIVSPIKHDDVHKSVKENTAKVSTTGDDMHKKKKVIISTENVVPYEGSVVKILGRVRYHLLVV